MGYLKDRDNPGQDLVIGGRKFRYEIHVDPDGGIVRLKPDGDPQNPVPARRVPHAVNSVQTEPGPDTSFGNEAFKVDYEGSPIPKGPAYLATPFPVGTLEAEAFINEAMDRVYANLG
jgi:hypothetical protein